MAEPQIAIPQAKVVDFGQRNQIRDSMLGSAQVLYAA